MKPEMGGLRSASRLRVARILFSSSALLFPDPYPGFLVSKFIPSSAEDDRLLHLSARFGIDAVALQLSEGDVHAEDERSDPADIDRGHRPALRGLDFVEALFSSVCLRKREK